MNTLIKITLNFLILTFDFWESVPIVYEVDLNSRVTYDGTRCRKNLMQVMLKEEKLSMTTMIVNDHIESEDTERGY